MKTLTIFTPTFNRVHTIIRTYESLCRQTCHDFEWLIIDDGSIDGTRNWVEGLGDKVLSKGQKFDWRGRTLDAEDDNHFMIELPQFELTYIYKPNGGLYTGYNVAYSIINTDLCVCVDSDDFMPDDAVEKIILKWKSRDSKKNYCGIVGLDYNVVDKKPIGGFFKNNFVSDFYADFGHTGDTKLVMRTDLMKTVSPMVGFPGEKDFNPFYMISQVTDEYPILVENSNLCWVEYQIGADSMSQGIFKQYVRSPKSFAKYRILKMKLRHGNSLALKYRNCGHYLSSCLISRDKDWLRNSPLKFLTILAIPLGVIIYSYIKYKNR